MDNTNRKVTLPFVSCLDDAANDNVPSDVERIGEFHAMLGEAANDNGASPGRYPLQEEHAAGRISGEQWAVAGWLYNLAYGATPTTGICYGGNWSLGEAAVPIVSRDPEAPLPLEAAVDRSRATWRVRKLTGELWRPLELVVIDRGEMRDAGSTRFPKRWRAAHGRARVQAGLDIARGVWTEQESCVPPEYRMTHAEALRIMSSYANDFHALMARARG